MTLAEFGRAWRARVDAGQGSRAAFELYQAARKAPTEAAFARCIETAAEKADRWGEAICELESYSGFHLQAVSARRAADWVRRGGELARELTGQEAGPYAASLNSLGVLAKTRGDLAAAQVLYDRALAIEERAFGRDHPEVASVLNNLAALAMARGDLDGARERFARTLAIFERHRPADDAELAIARQNLGTVLALKGDFLGASAHLERAVSTFENVLPPENPMLAAYTHNLGRVLEELGRYGEARRRYQRSLALREKVLGPWHPDVAESCNSLASLLQTVGEPVAARALYERALAINEKALGKDHVAVAVNLNNLADLLQSQGDPRTARALYERALAIKEKARGPNHPSVATTLNNLGKVLHDLGELAGARRAYERALAIRETTDGKDHPSVAYPLGNLASLAAEAGELAAARKLQERALAIQEKALGPAHPNVAASLTKLAGYRLAQGQVAAAQALYQQAIDLYERALGPDHPSLRAPLLGLAKLLFLHGERERARPLVERSLAIESRLVDKIGGAASEREKRLVVRTVQSAPIALGLAMAEDRPDAARWAFETALAWKGRTLDALAAERASLRDSTDPEVRRLFERLKSLRAAMASRALDERDPAHQAGQAQTLAEQQAELDRLEADLARRSAPFAAEQAGRHTRLEQICRALPRGAALYEQASALQPAGPLAHPEPRLLGLLVRADDCRVHLVDLGPSAALARAVGAWRASLLEDTRRLERGAGLGRAAALAAAGQRIRQLLWRPIEPWLGGIGHVYVAPEGPLHALPLAALPGRGGGFLAEEITLSVLTSGKDLLRPARTDGKGVLALGAPAFEGQGAPLAPAADASAGMDRPRGLALTERCASLGRARWSSLPETAEEVQAVAAAFPGAALLLGRDASLSAFRKQAPGRRLIHVASHGYFLGTACGKGDVNPLLLSGLVLAGANAREDGVLTALEVSGMDLGAAGLVVLSACETGLGETQTGEGVFGLQRAFVLAGAQGLVLSLFRVPSDQTTALMKDFYGHVREGLPAAEALRRAQLDRIRALRAAGELPHPLFWAGFVSMGR